MVEQRGYGKVPSGSFWEKTLTELGAPRKNEIYISQVYNVRNQFIPNITDENGFYLFEDVKELIKKEIGHENPIIRCYVEIGGGKDLSLGINSAQYHAFAIVYGMPSYSDAPHYASIENITGKEKLKKRVKNVLVKNCESSIPMNQVMISRALAKKLGVKRGQEIAILGINPENSEINLDDLEIL